jgi:secreted Zn-dependent insulinase-like peptidase
MRTTFRELSDETFNLHQESAYNTAVKKDTEPSEEFTRYKNEISTRRYMFNKREELGAAIKEATKETVKTLFERLFFGENRRIDLHILSAKLKPQQVIPPTAYKSLYALRRRLAIYPANPRP